MAEQQESAAPPATPPQRGGRGRGQSHRTPRGDANNGTESGYHKKTEANRGPRNRGRGRGGRGMGGRASENTEPVVSNNTRGANIGYRPPDTAKRSEVEGKGKQPASGEEEEEEEGEICFICASPVIHHALSPCNHRTCHICSLRLRALYKTKACAHCRSHSDSVIFTDDNEKRFEDFSETSFNTIDTNLGIKYDTAEIYADTLVLLRYNCPDETCDVACLGWPDLHRHVRAVHKQWMCDLCTRNKKVFTHEHELFTHNELRKHEKFGDDNPGAVDQTGFKGHPECGFCRQRFYGDDELYVHCREKHERCHICDRRNPGSNPIYYQDYQNLELHFQQEHFLCRDAECMEKKFVVFDSEIDLKAHQVEAHPHGLSRTEIRDARRVDLASFQQVRERYQPERRGGRDSQGRGGGVGRGRGRDPNSEPIPPSSAQPLGRAEMAFQRERAIQTAQSVAPRMFGGRLTAPEPVASPARPSRGPAAISTNGPPADTFPSLESLHQTVPQPSTDNESALTPQEVARRLQHNAVVERAAGMLLHDQKKVADFRDNVSSFKNGKITAPELIEAFFALFDRPTAEVGKLVKELAEIFEIPARRDELLKAWNDWKAINEDYPSLPGSSAAPSSSIGASYGSKRVLKLKTSTAQSARSPVSKTGSWGSTSNTSLFPALPPGAANRSGASRSTPWGGATQTVTKAPAVTRSAQRTAVTSTPSNSTSSEAFPALPTAVKPTSTYFGPGGTGNAVRRQNGAPHSSSPWGPGAANSGTNTPAVESETEQMADGKKKGNKKKGQTLFRFG